MPSQFGIYDFFSYTIPGVLYILVLNQVLQLTGAPTNLDISNLDNLGAALLGVLGIVAAYVTGQLMDTIGIRWYTLFNKFNAEIEAMREFKKENEDLGIQFGLNDRRILVSVVRHHSPDLASYVDNFKAVSIMLQNISLALFLFALVQLAGLITHGFSIASLLLIIAAGGFSYIAVIRSKLYNKWHWMAVFEQALHYGKSIPEMFPSPVESSAKKEKR